MAFTSKERVSFPSDAGSDCPGVMSGKVGSSTKGLVVIQEWWGMNQQIIDLSCTLAEKGDFVTVTPDLYRGKVTDDREEAGHFMGGLDWAGAVKDIEASAKFLLSKGCKKVGVTGFCMGGALSLAAAVLSPSIAASIPFYGIPGDQLVDVTKISIPLQCHFAETDVIEGFSSPKDYEALRKKLTDAGVKFEFYTYPTGHGFFNPANKETYNEELVALATSRLIEFTQRYLSE